MAAKPVGWGMIGTRGWSDMILGPAINAARGARFKAVLSTKQENAERYCASHGVARGYTDLKAFLADDAIDVVWIASPNHLHKEQTIAALKAGKHVLCEKPMAMNQAECRAMIRAAKKAERLLTIGYNSRHHPRLDALRAQWQAGRFGAPVHMHCQFRYRYPEVPDDWWRLDDEKSGCWVLGDIGTHFIDLLRWFNGEAKTVHAHLANKAYGRSADTAAVFHRLRQRCRGDDLGLHRRDHRRRVRAARQRELLHDRGRLRRHSGHHDHGAQGRRAARRPAQGPRHLQGPGGEHHPRRRPRHAARGHGPGRARQRPRHRAGAGLVEARAHPPGSVRLTRMAHHESVSAVRDTLGGGER